MKSARIQFREILSQLVIKELALVGLLALLCLTTGCAGGGGAAPLPPVVVTVTASPTQATVLPGAMQTFMANVTGTNNTAVTWTVQEAPAGGSITNAGVYTAPQVAGTYHVIATSVADTSKNGSATITVPPITVTVNPPTPTVFLGAVQAFVATVTATNMAVTWTIQEAPAGGSITSAGVYTAPQVVGTYHVIATSVADMSKNGSATITVPPVAISIAPMTDTLRPSGIRTFFARVTGASNTAVTWGITEGAAGGTVDVNGNYIAPTAQGTFHVVATSVADPTQEATATVTVVQSGFLPTGAMTTPRVAHTATLLKTGEPLVAGGITGSTLFFRNGGFVCVPVVTASVDLFNPGTGIFAATGPMKDSRSGHTATLLQDGKVLVAGGSSTFVGTAEIFDPATAAFTATGNMTSQRELHTATLLPSGKVLLTGGGGASAELFDPAMGAFASTGSMKENRSSHSATLLLTGKVLIVGGGGDSTAELYDPATGTFVPTGNMKTARRNHTATLLPDGSVLIAGGLDQSNTALTSAEIYNPVTGGFTATSSMATAHSQHTATLLPSGKVLVAGGGNFVAELFDPGTGTFSLTGSMTTSRTSHTGTLLPNGDVVVSGGGVRGSRSCSGAPRASAEVYH
jgi:hypothetical protein